MYTFHFHSYIDTAFMLKEGVDNGIATTKFPVLTIDANAFITLKLQTQCLESRL